MKIAFEIFRAFVTIIVVCVFIDMFEYVLCYLVVLLI